MIDLLNWISANPKMALGILVIICGTVIICVSEYLDRKHGSNF